METTTIVLPVKGKLVRLQLLCILGGVVLAACSGTQAPSTPAPTVFVPIVESSPVLAAPLASATSAPVPETTPNAASTALAVGTTSGGIDGVAPGLSGRFVIAQGGQGIFEISLPSGVTTTLFQMLQNSWLTSISVRPEDGALAVAYAPPPPKGEVQLGYTSIYRLPSDCRSRADGCTGDDLRPIVERSNPNEAFFSPVWSSDGQYLYFAHFMPSDANTSSPFQYTLERMAFCDDAPAGERELVAQDALWPAVSSDGQHIVYIYSDPVNYTNHLVVADPDGANPREIVGPDVFQAIDSPLFSADGSQVIFSAVDSGLVASTPAPVFWLDQLLGAQVVVAAPAAHNVPSDWWSIPTAGGTPKRLTNVAETGMFGDFSPDGFHFAYLSATGIYAMSRDGSDLRRLSDTGGYGTLEWLP